MNGLDIFGNEVFSGMLGGSLVLSAAYLLRSVPASVGEWLLWRFTSDVVVFNDDEAFDRIRDWLGHGDLGQKARRMRVASNEESFGVSPGLGWHVMWCGWRPVFVHRTLSDAKVSGSFMRQEEIRIVSVGKSPQVLRNMLGEIDRFHQTRNAEKVEVYTWAGYWRMASRKPRRPIDSVILPEGQRERIVRDLEHFVQARPWYEERGIPYRRGLLFHGPPGCGKTSLVLALAGHLSRRIYALNLGSLNGDDALIEAVAHVPENAILLIEDIDAAQRSRAEKPAEGTGEERFITLSALLNAIDGVFSTDGRILVMTTNHPGKIDPALTRPGRADLSEHVGEIGRPQVLEMARRFLGTEEEARDFARLVEVPVAPAEVQQKLMTLAAFGPAKGGVVERGGNGLAAVAPRPNLEWR